MNCVDSRVLLATRKDLGAVEEAALRAHLEGCAQCRTRWNVEERTTRALRTLPIPSPGVVDRVVAAANSGQPDAVRARWTARVSAIALLALAMMPVMLWLVTPTKLRQPGQSHLGPTPPQSYSEQNGARQEAAAGSTVETLYIGSIVIGQHVGAVKGARLAAVEPATQRERWRIDVGYDAVFAPDHRTIYISDGGLLTAVDTGTGKQRWQVPLRDTPGYTPGGPSVLGISPYGRWLYISGYDPGAGPQGPGWLQIADTSDGRVFAERVPLPDCLGPRIYTPPSGHVVYLLCPSEIRLLNTETREIEDRRLTEKTAWNEGVFSPDGRLLYIFDVGDRLTIFDTMRRTIDRVNLPRVKEPLSNGIAIALSADGARLILAQTVQEKRGTDNATLFRIYDTANWRELSRFRFEQPMTAIATDDTGIMIYGAFPRYAPDTKGLLPTDTVVAFEAASGRVVHKQVRSNEDIERLFWVSPEVVNPTLQVTPMPFK